MAFATLLVNVGEHTILKTVVGALSSHLVDAVNTSYSADGPLVMAAAVLVNIGLFALTALPVAYLARGFLSSSMASMAVVGWLGFYLAAFFLIGLPSGV